MMSEALSAREDRIISESLTVRQVPTPQDLGLSVIEMFEVQQTVETILLRDFHRIALQFPDEYLPYSVPVFQSLSSKLPNRDLYVLADTSHGSCCVDEVSAQHVDADAVVHYGHACLSPTSRIPTIYVFGKLAIDVQHCATSLLECCHALFQTDAQAIGTIFLMYNVAFAYRADAVCSAIQSRLPEGPRVQMSPSPPDLVPPSAQHSPENIFGNSPGEAIGSFRHNRVPGDLEPSRSVIFYVGGESMALTNILLMNSSFDIYSYDPERGSARLETGSNRILMRRYAIIQRARDADVFGILVGTLGVSLYLPLIAKLRRVLRLHHKKSYTLSVGKLNPAKLANFMEIECFIYVACPENSIVDAKDFLRPIITPYELDLALQNEVVWPIKYALDFDQVLGGGFANMDTSDEVGGRDPIGEEDAPRFSLVSGEYRHAKRYRDQGACLHHPFTCDCSLFHLSFAEQLGESKALILRGVVGPISDVLAGSTTSFLQTRTYQGLSTSSGVIERSVLEQGRSGTAQGYNELVGDNDVNMKISYYS
ncbi:putative diphthamide synthesis protein-domain-containing protein [Cantharellus anzutake]|uniref:putative diphthamide synthesis protein-domain-containing protein n=1 Tax=Cantharellus anzutake TaxID=1750568 RepID=UPI001903E39A|nr:putative diphthamide synthesis protein-domain-containing protein [Cantharellus anzutake]KAF8325189.1 putative diphthamide synthesis protein-domain-containing protein [Cantharellus anzutake]